MLVKLYPKTVFSKDKQNKEEEWGVISLIDGIQKWFLSGILPADWLLR